MRADTAEPQDSPAGQFVGALPGLAPVRVDGADAAAFLHGQFTSDVVGMAAGEVTLSAWCDAKGRTIADFILARLEQEFWLLLPATMQEAFVQRLRLYVLRATVNIERAPGGLACCAFIDADWQTLANSLPGADLAPGPRAARHNGYITITYPQSVTIALADAGQLRTLRQRCRTQFHDCDEQAWEAAMISAGVPWLHPQTSGKFLPQELNLDRLGALSYDKGCYPGQEIITRLRYRGQVRRRLSHVTTNNEASLEPGAKLPPDAHGPKAGIALNSAVTDHGQQALVMLERPRNQAD